MRGLVVLVTFSVACSAGGNLGSTTEAVLGADRFDGSCSNTQETLILKAERFARQLANSPAYADCVQRALSATFTFTTATGSASTGPYQRCQVDPTWAGESVSQVFNDVMSVARSPNNLLQGCTATSTNGALAFTTQRDGLYHLNDEGFQWDGPVVSNEAIALASPTLCGGSVGYPGCHYPFPWPLQYMAGTMLHEVSHTHNFDHDFCGPEPSGWGVENTIPGILASCARFAAEDSTRSNAGGPLLANGCPRGQLSMATTMGGTSLTCVDDPRLSSLSFAHGHGTTISAAGWFTLDGAGNIFRRVASSWTWIGFPGRQFAANDDALYAITSDGSQVVRYDGAAWSQIGGTSQQLIVGGHQVYSIASDGFIWRYNNSPFNWTQIGGPGAQFVAGSNGLLYALNGDRSAVLGFTDSYGWQVIGGAASQLFMVGSVLHAVSADRFSISKFSVASWVPVVSSTYALQGWFYGAAGNHIYGLYAGKLTEYRGVYGRTTDLIAEDALNVVDYGGRVVIDRTDIGPHEWLRP